MDNCEDMLSVLTVNTASANTQLMRLHHSFNLKDATLHNGHLLTLQLTPRP